MGSRKLPAAAAAAIAKVSNNDSVAHSSTIVSEQASARVFLSLQTSQGTLCFGKF